MAGPNRGMPATHRYTEADLRPVLRDPRCNPQFPLANYWPVYLGNFYCEPYSQHAVRIQEYFGSKGLLARMVFGRNEVCDPFFAEQRRCKLYDFLVYFVSQQDAQDAVHYCNRDMYYGHRLNVLPGRRPEFFDISRSVKHSVLQPGKLGKMAEQAFEQYIYNICRARTGCIVKHNATDLFVEYCSLEDRTMALQYCKIALPELISMNKTKQRFLECDVLKEIMEVIQKTPSFMNMLPPGSVLQALMNGLLPQSTMSWKTLNTVPYIRQIRVFGPRKKRKSHLFHIYLQTKRLFGVDQDRTSHLSEEVQGIQQQRKLEARRDQ